MLAKFPMDCWSADLIGPFSKVYGGQRFNLSTPGGHTYCLVIVDHYSRYTMGVLLHKKSDATDKLIHLITQMQNSLGIRLKRFHCDGGGEFNNQRFKDFLSKEGILLTTTVADTSEHNGIVENMNQRLETNARCLIHQSKGPPELWGYAILHCILLHNISTLRVIDMELPIERFYSKPFRDISALSPDHLRIFGCDVFVHIPQSDRGKFDLRASRGVYIGYSAEKNAHHILMCDTLKERIERDVKFKEQSFRHLQSIYHALERKSEENLGLIAPEELKYEVERIVNERVYRGKQQYYVKWKKFMYPTWEPSDTLQQDCPDIVQEYLNEKKQLKSPSSHSVNVSIMNYKTPDTYSEAMAHPDREKWELSMMDELKSLNINNTWVPAVLPAGRKALSTRWVYKAKHNDQNEIIRYKSRLVVKGYLQRIGIDYNETFAPTVHLKTIKYMLAMAAELDLEIMQIDFDTAFLHAPLKEEIYIKIPKGYELPKGYERCNCLLLLKSLYGLKQAPREWYLSLNNALESLGYTSSPLDACLYMKVVNGYRIYATVYVDDLLFLFPKVLTSVWESDKQTLSQQFKIKDIGECEWILNMRIERDRQRRTITLSQETYVNQILYEFDLPSDRYVGSPYKYKDITVCLDGMDSTPLSKEDHSKYRSIVGELMWISMITRIDIAHIANQLSRYVSSPLEYHLQAAYRVLQYLYHHRKEQLIFKGNPRRSTNAFSSPFDIKIYTDSDYADERDDRVSVSGWVVTLNDRPVTWKSKKQSTVALSSTEAELYAIAEGVRESLFLRQWLEHYFNVKQSIIMNGDNNGSQKSADHSTNHEKTKHYDVKCFFVREHLKSGNVILSKVASQENLADILTKPGLVGKFTYLRTLLLHSSDIT